MSAVSVTGHTDEIDDRDAIGVMPRAPPASGPSGLVTTPPMSVFLIGTVVSAAAATR